MVKKTMKKYKKAIIAYTTSGMTMGAGSYAVGKIPTSGATSAAAMANVQQGYSNLASFYPVTATVVGAGGVVNLTKRSLGGLQMARKKRKKKRR